MLKAAEVAAPTITLTPDELHALTGYRRPDEQLRAFLAWFAGQVLRRIGQPCTLSRRI